MMLLKTSWFLGFILAAVSAVHPESTGTQEQDCLVSLFSLAIRSQFVAGIG
jgi:hypothetical protein